MTDKPLSREELENDHSARPNGRERIRQSALYYEARCAELERALERYADPAEWATRRGPKGGPMIAREALDREKP